MPIRHLLSAACSLVLLAAPPFVRAQTTGGGQLPAPAPTNPEAGVLSRYRANPVQTIRFNDTQRLDTLVRAGNLYLSLRDAIALAIENNLDVEYQRLTPAIAEADLLRARAGGIARGIPSNVQQGPSGFGGGSGQGGGISGQSGGAQTGGGLGLTTGTSVALAGPQQSASGPAVPSLDPALVGSFGWEKANRPQTATFLTGTNALTNTSRSGDLRLQKGFLSGASASLGYDASRTNSNSLRADVNPSTTAGLGLTVTQPLLQGFGFAVNNRYIRIAKNNRQVSDLVFEEQVLTTAHSVARLYWDLVSLTGEVNVQRQTVELNERLLQENRQQEEAGTLAPIEVTRARAEVARARRDLTVAETRVRQQETVIKDYLTRGTVDTARLAALRIIPTDTITPPAEEPVEPLQDLVAAARKRRPELAQVNLQTDNSRIALVGSRNALLPSLDLVASARSNALFGTVSDLPAGEVNGQPLVRQPDPAFLGGLTTGFTQLFGNRFPDYSLQVQLSVPILNRAARADYTRDQLALRQQEIRQQQLEKQLRVEVVNALIAVEQSRAAYNAALEARTFQEQSLQAEREKYAVGASTNFLVIQYQRDLALSQSAEVTALTDYAKARASLDRATGLLLDKQSISIVDAYRSQLPASQPPMAP